MLLTVKLTQTNAKNETVFNANRTVNIGNSEIESVSLEIGSFCKDLQGLIERNKAKGFKTNFGLRKSLKTSLELISEDGDNLCSLQFKNFGKFVDEVEKATLVDFLRDNIGFTVQYAGTEIELNDKKFM